MEMENMKLENQMFPNHMVIVVEQQTIEVQRPPTPQENISTTNAGENVAPKTEENKEDITTANCRMHFEVCKENGKTFSKCLIEGCGRRLTGKHSWSLIRHLRSLHSSKFKSSIEDDEEDEVFDSLDCFQFFDTIIDDKGKTYSKCLIYGCNRRLLGKNTWHLMRHLRTLHASFFKYKKEDNPKVETEETDIYDIDALNCSQYFEIDATDEHGKSYSRCLIEGCDRRLQTKSEWNLIRHLRKVHPTKCEENADNDLECSKYFSYTVEDGKTFSTCTFDGCGRRLAGKGTWSLMRHLRKMHAIGPKKGQVGNAVEKKAADKNASDDNASDDNASDDHDHDQDHANDDNDIESNANDSRASDEHAKDGQNQSNDENATDDKVIDDNAMEISSSSDTECEDEDDFETNCLKYFKIGKVTSKCLFEGCDIRLATKETWKLTNHLRMKHSTRKHKNVQMPTSSKDVHGNVITEGTGNASGSSSAPTNTKMCRLCFEQKPNGIHISANKSKIAEVIRLHFPSNQTREDLLPQHVCPPCWFSMHTFHKFYLTVNDAEKKYLKTLDVSDDSDYSNESDDNESSKVSEMKKIKTRKNDPAEPISTTKLRPKNKQKVDASSCEESDSDSDTRDEEFQCTATASTNSKRKFNLRKRPTDSNVDDDNNSSKRMSSTLDRRKLTTSKRCGVSIRSSNTLTTKGHDEQTSDSDSNCSSTCGCSTMDLFTPFVSTKHS